MPYLDNPPQETDLDAFKNEIHQIVEKMKVDNPEFTKEVLAEHERVLTDVFINLKSPAESMGFSPQFIEALYAIGYQAFKSGTYETAYSVFKLLSSIDPTKPRYAAGLASIHYAKKEWKEAQNMFMAASIIDEVDPMPYFYIAECAVEQRELIEALFFYHAAILRAKALPQYEQLVQRIKLSIDGIEKVIPEDQKGGVRP